MKTSKKLPKLLVVGSIIALLGYLYLKKKSGE